MKILYNAQAEKRYRVCIEAKTNEFHSKVGLTHTIDSLLVKLLFKFMSA